MRIGKAGVSIPDRDYRGFRRYTHSEHSALMNLFQSLIGIIEDFDGDESFGWLIGQCFNP